MNQKKKAAPLVLGIFSIITGVLFAIVGLITGIIGLILAINSQKADNLSYKLEIILNSVGIGISTINMILGFMLAMSVLNS